MTSESGEEETPDAGVGEISKSDQPPLVQFVRESRAVKGNIIFGRGAKAAIRGDTAVGEEDSLPDRKLIAMREDAKDRDSERTLKAQQYAHEQKMQQEEHTHRARMQRLVLAFIFITLFLMFSVVMIAGMRGTNSSEFALEMGRMVLPGLIGSAGTIVGAMFVGGRKGS